MAKRIRPKLSYVLTWTVFAILLAGGAVATGIRDVSHSRGIFMYVIGSIAVIACLYHWFSYFMIKK
jgi:hypothetical protein